MRDASVQSDKKNKTKRRPRLVSCSNTLKHAITATRAPVSRGIDLSFAATLSHPPLQTSGRLFFPPRIYLCYRRVFVISAQPGYGGEKRTRIYRVSSLEGRDAGKIKLA